LRRGIATRSLASVAAAFALLAEVGCGSSTGSPTAAASPGSGQPSAAAAPGSGNATAIEAALQDSDVVGALGRPHRCALSGSIDTAIAAIRSQGNPTGADSLQTMWSNLKAGGAQEGAYVVYMTSDHDCPSTTFGPTMASLSNIVVKFDTAEHATAAFQSGALAGGATPAQIGSVPGSQVGQQTGLGANSWTVSTDMSPNGMVASATAAWAIDKYCSILGVFGGDPGEMQNLAGKVNTRE
jgi:hypothetical protein